MHCCLCGRVTFTSDLADWPPHSWLAGSAPEVTALTLVEPRYVSQRIVINPYTIRPSQPGKLRLLVIANTQSEIARARCVNICVTICVFTFAIISHKHEGKQRRLLRAQNWFHNFIKMTNPAQTHTHVLRDANVVRATHTWQTHMLCARKSEVASHVRTHQWYKKIL